jgi:hypothetical protein
MVYLTLIVWLWIIALSGIGLYRYWTAMLGGAVVDWCLLPASLLSEGAYSIGRVLTGRPAFGGIISPQNVNEDPCRVAITGKHGFWVALLSSSLAILISMAVLLISANRLGADIIRDMATANIISHFHLTALPKSLPTSWNELWTQLAVQVEYVERITTAWSKQDWLDWHVPVFVYLGVAFSVRLTPTRQDRRATLAAVGGFGLCLTLLAALIPPFHDKLTGDLWYLLTYVWATLLTGLLLTMIAVGLRGLVGILLNLPPRT